MWKMKHIFVLSWTELLLHWQRLVLNCKLLFILLGYSWWDLDISSSGISLLLWLTLLWAEVGVEVLSKLFQPCDLFQSCQMYFVTVPGAFFMHALRNTTLLSDFGWMACLSSPQPLQLTASHIDVNDCDTSCSCYSFFQQRSELFSHSSINITS